MMDRLTAYLRIHPRYADYMRGLHWSSGCDVIEFDDGSTFAFPGEIFKFLDGYISQRPLIHFAHMLHLLHLLKDSHTPFLGRDEEALSRAFGLAQRPYRNAGVFCAVLCADIPAVPDPPLLSCWTGSFQLEVSLSESPLEQQGGGWPSLHPEVFEARVLFALSSYSFEDILHWFRYGRGPVHEAGEDVARVLLLDKPRSLRGILADLTQDQRLGGAVPFVEQFVSALTLPPRRLEHPELPLGGYSDVTTRGQVEQLLPSQFAFDDLEFVRRHAESELLYFRREDPHVHMREDLVVLLDQGVRTWGSVRLVLAAALFALGRLAERRRLPFLVSATSGDELLDPLRAAATELQELIEASDLSRHPGPALDRVLSEATDTARDIVLLTHPRNLAEPEVIAAARGLPANARLFAVAVSDHGDVEFSAVRHGAPVCLSRFRVDLEHTAPPSMNSVANPLTRWRGDVEPVPYPFRFGLASDKKPIHFAFDAAGEWLLVATHGGMLHASRTDGSRGEILPRGLVQNTIVANVVQVIGVAGGFVVIGLELGQTLALHYDFRTRNYTAHSFTRPTTPDVVNWFYLRSLHTLVVRGRHTECIQLSTGSRERPPAAFETLDSRIWSSPLPIQGQGEPVGPNSPWCWPQIHLDPDSGTVDLRNVVPAWEIFTPLADNRPILKGCKLGSADCQENTLAALFTNPERPGDLPMLRLFRGPKGVPLAVFTHKRTEHRFALSSDGRLLARTVGRGRVEVRDALVSKAPLHVTPVGRFHHQIEVELGECWLSLRIDRTVHLARWNLGTLVLKCGQWYQGFVNAELNQAGLPINGCKATLRRLPSFLADDSVGRFVSAAWSNLIAVVDRFGEVALFEQTGGLVCMFFAFKGRIAVWMPDGTCHGPTDMLGRPATPNALGKVGAALRAAWERGERTVV